MQIFKCAEAPNLPRKAKIKLDADKYMLYAFGKVYGASMVSCRRWSGSLDQATPGSENHGIFFL